MGSVVAFDGRNLFTFVMSLLTAGLSYIDVVVDRSLTITGALAVPCSTIVFAIQGIRVAHGVSSQSARGLAAVVAKVAVIVACLNASTYVQWVQDFVIQGVSGDLAGLVSNTSGVSTGAGAFDAVLNKVLVVGWDYWDSYRIYNPAKYLAVLLWLIGGIALVFGFGVYLLGWFLTVLYVAVGPFFILALMFDVLRGLFASWIGCLIGAVLLEALAVILPTLTIMGEQQLLNFVVANILGDGNAMIGALLCSCLLLALCGWVALKLPAVATSLSGGVNFYPSALQAATYGAMMEAGKQLLRTASTSALQTPARARQALLPHANLAPPGPSLSRARP